MSLQVFIDLIPEYHRYNEQVICRIECSARELRAMGAEATALKAEVAALKQNFTQALLREAQLESEVAALQAELEQHKASLPTCEKHKPDRGARSGCVICSGHTLSYALSRIDYACGEPNEMECSDYDVHYNEDEVVKRVVALRAEVEKCQDYMHTQFTDRRDAERYRWLRDVVEGSDAWNAANYIIECPSDEWDAAIDAALKAAQPPEMPSTADDEVTRWRHGEPTQPERVSVPVSDERIMEIAKSVGMQGMLTDVVTTTDELKAFARALLAAAQEGK